MSYKDDEKLGHSNWVRQLAKAQQNVLQNLSAVEVNGGDPTSVFADSIDHRRLHAATLNYYELVNPFRRKVEDIWCKSYRYQTEVGSIEISLQNLSDWRMRYVQVSDQKTDPVEGESSSTENRRLWLPVLACARLHSDLNDCLEDLKLAAQVAEATGFDAPPEVPEHVLNNAPAYQTAETDGGEE